MKQQFDNNLGMSFYLWAENYLLDKGESYITKTSKLYYTPDRARPGYVAYSAPYKQWVYDSGVSGAHVCEAISGSFGTLTRGQSGLTFDYENGRILLSGSMGGSLNISGTYSIKEINFYTANETDDSLIVYGKYFENPRFVKSPTSGIQPYDLVVPAIFINSINSHNENFALGGMDNTKINMSVIVMAENLYQLNATLSLFRDAKNRVFPLIPIELDPLNEFGDLKSGYNYKSIMQQYGTPGNLCFIDSVQTSKLSDSAKVNAKLFVGFADVDVSFPRYPRL